MPDCRLCPRQCGADRAVSAGVCHMGSAVRVARAAPHYGEEPCISGERGSGAVFFAGCPLGCVYCQNYALSRGRIGETVSVERLAAIFAGLEAKGVHNLNLVTGTQFTPEIREALTIAKPKIPVVWNTSGYETVDTVDALAPQVSVFLPDLKYTDPALAARYSRAPDYPAAAKNAIKRMVEHTGAFELDEKRPSPPRRYDPASRAAGADRKYARRAFLDRGHVRARHGARIAHGAVYPLRGSRKIPGAAPDAHAGGMGRRARGVGRDRHLGRVCAGTLRLR